MPTPYETIIKELKSTPETWLITGVAGFIGSNLLETLLRANQIEMGLDDPEKNLFFVGYQTAGPPGESRLVHGEPHPNRYGRKIERLAR